MADFLNSALAFVVAIGLLVAVHEFGHYSAARLLGVKVLRFSIGFGRVLWSRRGKRDETEYCLSAIPLGGYVKLLDERDCAVAFAEQPRAFNRRPPVQRIAILAAGPAFNLVFAVMAYTVLYITGVPGLRPVVGEVMPGSVAALAGLESGDTITAVRGTPVATWESTTIRMLDAMLADGEIRLAVAGDDDRKVDVVLPTAGRESALTEPGRLFDELGLRPFRPRLAAILGELTPGGPAERAGLRSGDRVLAADGNPIADWEDWVQFVRERPDTSVTVTVRRGDGEFDLPVTLAAVEDEDGNRIGRIGVAVYLDQPIDPSLRAVERHGPLAALRHGAFKTWDMALLTLRMIWRMVVGDVSVKNISGPINIAQYAGQSAMIGLPAFLGFLAIVSISLGVLNLLPVPLLDGGQILYTLIEVARGSPLSEQAQMVGQQVGIFLLLLLMSFAFYNDIVRLLG